MISRRRGFLARLLDDGTTSLQRCPHCGYFNCLWADPYLEVLENGLARLSEQGELQRQVVLGVDIVRHTERVPAALVTVA